MFHKSLQTDSPKVSPAVPSVSQQLQKYRELNARNNAEISKHPCAVSWRHPDTKDYFKKLMQRWQQQYAQDVVSAE